MDQATMVLSDDQLQVKTLLQDTIALLCKNGLVFQQHFTINAVIGVTLDDQSLFYMSFNDVIKSDKCRLPTEEDKNEEPVVTQVIAASARKKRKLQRNHLGPDDADSYVSEISQTSTDVVNPKTELNHSDNDETVTVKEEVDSEFWGQLSATDLTDQSFISPGTSGAGSQMTLPVQFSTEKKTPPKSKSIPASQTAESFKSSNNIQTMMMGGYHGHCYAGIYDNTIPWQPSDKPRSYTYKCQLCDKSFSCPDNLRGHMAQHTGRKEFRCKKCGKQYQYNCTLQRHGKICIRRGASSPSLKPVNIGELGMSMGMDLSQRRDSEDNLNMMDTYTGMGLLQNESFDEEANTIDELNI